MIKVWCGSLVFTLNHSTISNKSPLFSALQLTLQPASLTNPCRSSAAGSISMTSLYEWLSVLYATMTILLSLRYIQWILYFNAIPTTNRRLYLKNSPPSPKCTVRQLVMQAATFGGIVKVCQLESAPTEEAWRCREPKVTKTGSSMRYHRASAERLIEIGRLNGFIQKEVIE